MMDRSEPAGRQASGDQSMDGRTTQSRTRVMGAGMVTRDDQATTQKTLATRRHLLVMAVCGAAHGLAWPIKRPKRIAILATKPRRPQGFADLIAEQMAAFGWKEGRDYF